MIGKYKSGKLLSEEDGDILPKYRDIVIYKKIRRMKLTGCSAICIDGEIIDCSEAQIEVVPGALKYCSQRDSALYENFPVSS